MHHIITFISLHAFDIIEYSLGTLTIGVVILLLTSQCGINYGWCYALFSCSMTVVIWSLFSSLCAISILASSAPSDYATMAAVLIGVAIFFSFVCTTIITFYQKPNVILWMTYIGVCVICGSTVFLYAYTKIPQVSNLFLES